MKLVPSKVGAEPKKIGFLVVLVVVAGGVYLYNSSSGGGTSSAPAVTRGALTTSASDASAASGRSTYRVVTQGTATREFKPSLKIKNLEPSNIDPTLRLDLIAKLKTVDVEAGKRSLFEIGEAPPEEIKVKEPGKIEIAHPFVGPQLPRSEQAGAAAEQKAPPIPLKFYGFVNRTKAGDKRAFFMDGEDIVIAGEGDTVKKRYKIVRIGVNSAVVEDTEFKGNNKEQTLPLEAELPG
jgi:hypothetical protein